MMIYVITTDQETNRIMAFDAKNPNVFATSYTSKAEAIGFLVMTNPAMAALEIRDLDELATNKSL